MTPIRSVGKHTRLPEPGGVTKLGVMGGTFNPIHYGHLVAAEEARAQFGLEVVLFIPTGKFEHKELEKSVSDGQRLMMVEIATAANHAFEVSRLEIDATDLTYTVDTMRALRNEYLRAEMYFITGADSVIDLSEWKERESLAEVCRFIAATRPGYDLSKLAALNAQDSGLPVIDIMEVPALAISSSDLRRRVREGRSIRYLLPDSIAHYIYKQGLYL